MKRSVYLLLIILVVSTLSGCIIGKSPNTNNVTIAPGEATTFSVIVFPFGGTYTWTLDNAPLDNATSSYQYTPTGGQHVLVVSATHIFGTDTQTWNITCPEVSAPIGSVGGTIAVTNPASPIAGAQAVIPAGALASIVTITITQVTMPAGLPSQPAGPCVDFGPDGTEFSTPVELSLPYADANDDGIVDGTVVSEDQVKAYYYNETTSAWEEVQVIGRDPETNLVRISVTHLSKYTTGVTSFVTWQRLWGGSGYEFFIDVYPTTDGNYIAAGNYSMYGDSKGFDVLKFNSAGDVLWQKLTTVSCYPPFGSIISIRPTSDGGYITAGFEGLYPQRNICLKKLDAVGNTSWRKWYGGSGTNVAVSMQQTIDGGYIIAGYSDSTDFPGVTNHGAGDMYVAKLDAVGKIVWQRMYGGSGVDQAYSVQQTSDGGFIVGGSSSSTDIPGVTNHGGNDAYILKLNAAGEVQWQQMYGGSGDDMSTLNSPQPTNDGGYIVAGYSNSTDIPGVTNIGDNDGYLLKINAAGGIIWQRMCGGTNSDQIWSIQGTIDGGYIVAGYSNSTDITDTPNHGDYDVYLAKFDQDGNIIWQRMYGGSDSDHAQAVRQTTDGGFIVVGITYSNDIEGTANYGGSGAYVLKLDPSGNLQSDWLRDSDSDGLMDVYEILMETNPIDADTDDDGIMDGAEDSNHNGIVDPWETDPSNPDTDGDGIQDGTELGVTVAGPGTDTAFFQPDLDPTTTTNPLSSDTDGDGIPDGVEDANHNGRVDPGESNPNGLNQAPAPNAGPNQTVAPDATGILDGSGTTDPDNNIASYHWQQTDGPTVTLTNAYAAIAQFNASVAVGSILTFELIVTDALGLQATDACVITVTDPVSQLLNSLVPIPAGTFMMGILVSSYTMPVHAVTLQAFEIGAYEVTQAQYAAVMGTNPSYFQGTSYPGTYNNPVETVSWYDARAFCTALSALTGRTFTLPSEAQWEYACRAGTTTLFSFGDDDGLLGDYAWTGANSNNTTHPVGTKLPNNWNLHDMHGNVYEWCLDSWHENYTGAPNDGSAWEPETGSHRISRGGSWYPESPSLWYWLALRSNYFNPDFRHSAIGFRVVAIP